MNDRKQLECQLNCKSTASLDDEVAKDICKKDKCLASILQEEQNDSEDKDNNEFNDGVGAE